MNTDTDFNKSTKKETWGVTFIAVAAFVAGMTLSSLFAPIGG
ncbi:hypothetical protein SmphiM6_47 [Sinorhizobium phage phiM6]|jgi:hypothetical protein|nr:hypothetical protein SmphiM6_47 [Sinorhizobium phage phiM6]